MISVLIGVLIIVVVGAMGDRQVRHRQPTSKSAQVARGARLPRRNCATSAAANILANAPRLVELGLKVKK